MGKNIHITKKQKLKPWIKKHKKEIISTAIFVGIFSAVIVYCVCLKKQVSNLKELNFLLQEENNLCNKKIQRLIERHHIKDVCTLEAVSDGLRHGSPICAQVMADRKAYLNGLY